MWQSIHAIYKLLSEKTIISCVVSQRKCLLLHQLVMEKLKNFFYFFAKGTLKSPETSINTGEMPIFNLH